MEFLTFLMAAVFIEGLVEYVFKQWTGGWWIRYVALTLGIVFALVYKLDLMGQFGFHAFSPYVGYVVTGLIIGRGSNFVSDFFSKWKGTASLPPTAPTGAA